MHAVRKAEVTGQANRSHRVDRFVQNAAYEKRAAAGTVQPPLP